MTRSELEIIIKKRAAIWVTALAAMLAVNGWIGGSNSSRIMSSTIQANNLWAWYQAKNVRATINEVAGKQEEVTRLKADMDELSAKAKSLETEREKAQARSPYFTYAGIALQLGIVLSTAAILAVAMPLFWGSVGVGTVGAAMFAIGQFGF